MRWRAISSTSSAGNGPHFDIDLVLYDMASGTVRCVLDTKYKAPDTPSTADISQVVAYATAKDCDEAVLIYPTQLPSPLDAFVGEKQKIHVRSLVFALDGDLEAAGQRFIDALFAN